MTSSSSQPEVTEQNPAASASNEERSKNKENDEDSWEEERSWRDPSAHDLRSVVVDWCDIRSTRRAMQVSFVSKCLSNKELAPLIAVLNRTSQIKNVLMFNHTSTSFWLPSANVRYWRRNITDNWRRIFSP